MQVKLSSGFMSLKGKAEQNQAFKHYFWIWLIIPPVMGMNCSALICPDTHQWLSLQPKGAGLAQQLCTGTSQPPLLLLVNWINSLLSASKMLTPHLILRDLYTARFLKFREETVLFISHQICHWKLWHLTQLYFRKITFSLWSFWLTLLNHNQQWGLDYWIAVISRLESISFTLFWIGP